VCTRPVGRLAASREPRPHLRSFAVMLCPVHTQPIPPIVRPLLLDLRLSLGLMQAVANLVSSRAPATSPVDAE